MESGSIFAKAVSSHAMLFAYGNWPGAESDRYICTANASCNFNLHPTKPRMKVWSQTNGQRVQSSVTKFEGHLPSLNMPHDKETSAHLIDPVFENQFDSKKTAFNSHNLNLNEKITLSHLCFPFPYVNPKIVSLSKNIFSLSILYCKLFFYASSYCIAQFTFTFTCSKTQLAHFLFLLYILALTRFCSESSSQFAIFHVLLKWERIPRTFYFILSSTRSKHRKSIQQTDWLFANKTKLHSTPSTLNSVTILLFVFYWDEGKRQSQPGDDVITL